jgi:probable HAF family extracellular repeat protein
VRNIDGSLFQYELNFPCSSFHIKKSIDDKLWISLYSEENRGSKLWVWDGDLIELGTCSDVEIIGLNNYFDYCGNMIQKPGGLKRAVFIRDGDSPVFIDPADAVESYVVGINNNRQVVGNYIVTPSPQAFAWKAGVWNSIGTLGGGWSKAILTNESDAVAGISQTSDGEEHAFIWSENRIQDIGTLGGSWSRPEIIDSRGAVFGVSETADGRTARFLYRNNQIHEITGDSETDHLMFEYGENDMGGWDSLSFNESPPGLGENVVIGYYAARMDSYTEARYPPYTPFAKVENKTIYLDIPPGYRWAYPQYVNQVGQIVGKSSPPEYLPLLRQSDSCRSGIFPMPPYYPYQEGQPVFWNPCPEIERLNGREDGSMELRLNIWPLFQGSSYVLEESPTPLGPWITWEIFSDIDRVSSFSVQMKPEEDRFITSGFYRVREILHP